MEVRWKKIFEHGKCMLFAVITECVVFQQNREKSESDNRKKFPTPVKKSKYFFPHENVDAKKRQTQSSVQWNLACPP